MKLAYRIAYSPERFEDDEGFDELCKHLTQWRDCIDEVAVFTEYCHHGYYSPEHILRLQPIFRRRMEQLRGLDISSVGLNILETVGQLDEAWSWMEASPFQTVVGHDGRTTTSAMCIRAQGYREYIRFKYQTYAQANPDFIWVDDDIRVQGHSAAFPCFCHRCVYEFNRLTGWHFRRETLVEALNSLNGRAVREAWTDFHRSSLNDLMAFVGDAVREVNPAVKMGLMTINLQGNTYGLSDQYGLLTSLKADMIRPGEGFYEDTTPGDIFAKTYSVALQLADAPIISDRQYELEDFPDPGCKSVRMHMLELTAACMAGCNGIAFSVTPGPGSAGLLEAVRRHREMWHFMVDAGDGWRLAGGHPVLDKHFDAKRLPRRGNWFERLGDFLWREELKPLSTGLPYTPYGEDCSFTILAGDMAQTLDEKELLAYLSGGIMMDGVALDALTKRGYGDLCGGCVADTFDNGMRERYSDHPLNGDLVGTVRDVYQTFWPDVGLACALKPAEEGALVLTSLESVTGQQRGVASYAFENHLGGRIVVMGYAPWKYSQAPARLAQLRRLTDWLSRGRIPVVVKGGSHVIPLIKRPSDAGGFMLMLVNAHLDRTNPLEVTVRAPIGRPCAVFDEDGVMRPLQESQYEVCEGIVRLRLPSMQAWEHRVIVSERS